MECVLEVCVRSRVGSAVEVDAMIRMNRHLALRPRLGQCLGLPSCRLRFRERSAMRPISIADDSAMVSMLYS